MFLPTLSQGHTVISIVLNHFNILLRIRDTEILSEKTQEQNLSPYNDMK